MDYIFDREFYTIENYNRKPPFSSFLPGICGMIGIPLWAFYVNRGQGIVSFGINDKNNAIMEFSPAVISYEDASRKGFRTFIRIGNDNFEAFGGTNPDDCNFKRMMHIKPNSLIIEEHHKAGGFSIKVEYFLLPEAPIGALVRHVTLKNLFHAEISLEMLDGMARIQSFGIANDEFKEMANLLRSFSEVRYSESGAALFACRSTVDDSEEVEGIKGMYFYVTVQNGEVKRAICDSTCIFGYNTGLDAPVLFREKGLTGVMSQKQHCENKIPCAFTPIQQKISAEAELSFTTYIGFAPDEEELEEYITNCLCSADFYYHKAHAASMLTWELTKDIRTKTSNPLFDAYLEQCYLDNIIRGGYPYVLAGAKKSEMPKVIHLFSRKHGDLERDYNFFKTEAVFYSQGNGNFRDVCQNRRDSVLFVPEIDDCDIMTFANLLQIDGYNPLELMPTVFELEDQFEAEAKTLLKQNGFAEGPADAALSELKKGCTPGEFCRKLEALCSGWIEKYKDVFEELLSLCSAKQQANYKEGFWIDHWTYLLHLIKSYLEVFPDHKRLLFFEKAKYKFFDSPAFVNPRALKYRLNGETVVQYGSVAVDKTKLGREKKTNWLHDDNGNQVETTLFVKLFHLAVIKCLTLDPRQMGIEMEAGKPGWNDAFNGLPGLIGSSTSETFDLLALIDCLADCLALSPQKITMPFQIKKLGDDLKQLCEEWIANTLDAFGFWDKSAHLREMWRDITRYGLKAGTEESDKDSITAVLTLMKRIVISGIEEASKFGLIIPTYFRYKAAEYEIINQEGSSSDLSCGLHEVKVKAFAVEALPAFLEAPAKQLRYLPHNIHNAILNSGLYDRKLKMFKISESIEALDISYGRIRAFTPGWFERESIFLHMSYKYLLALIEAGMTDAFYEALKTSCVPFFNPEVYGRSIIENSSFIVSSENPDETVHGRGYIARLSGSAAEMISIWKRMFIGDKLFQIEDGKLVFVFNPKLQGWLFDEKGCVSTVLFDCHIRYINPKRKNTYGTDAVKIRRIITDGNVTASEGDSGSDRLSGSFAEMLRERKLSLIEVYFD